MNIVAKFLTFCRRTCLGGSESGACDCRTPDDCVMKDHPQYAKYSKDAVTRICRYGANGQFSIANDFTRFPAGRRKADGPYSGEHLREVILQRLREGGLTVNFDGTLGYGSSFLQGAFEGLAKEVDVRHLHLVCADTSIVTEVWRYIDSEG